MRSNRHRSQSSRQNKSHKRKSKQNSGGINPAAAAEILALEPRLLMSAVPALSSHPGAYQKLYLDFTGDYTANWGSYHPNSTPAYDTDGNAGSFSSGEISNIQQIWARVAEKYSPFNIDVTTVDPGSLGDKQAFRIVIGGNGSWTGGGTGGITWVNGYNNSLPNTGYVFSGNLGNGDPRYVGDAVAHEAGHGFGLNHQSSYSGTYKTAAYNQGNSAIAPIMGNSYYAQRSLWWYGQTEASSSTYQDDLAVLGNSIGYRNDDYGNWTNSAANLSLSGTYASASGVIERTGDSDFFSFSTGGGNVSFTANPSSYGGMLDLQLSLYNSSGSRITNADTGSLGETVSSYLSAGTYYVAVASHGNYGDVGQYSLSGSIGSTGGGGGGGGSTNTGGNSTSAPYAPSNASASSSSTSQVNLTWSDNSSNETGFKIERTTNTGGWTQVATVGANVTAYVDTGLNAATDYGYRIRAVNAGGDSGYSNSAWVTTRPASTTPTPTPPPTGGGNTSTNDGGLPSGTKVTGTAIGTAGSWNGSGATLYNALDGNLNSYFDAPTSQAYVGYDLGSGNARVITAVRFAPRSGQSSRMVGGLFQGSNDGSNWSTLYTVTSQPAEGQYTSALIGGNTAYRYLRYLSPNGGYGNVADVEFYSAGSSNNSGGGSTGTGTSSKLTGTEIGTSGSWNNSGATLYNALDGNLNSYFDAPTSQAWVGYDLGSGNARVVTSVRYAPRSGQASRMVGGLFQGSNDGANWSTLYTVTSQPAEGQYTSALIGGNTAYRYLRYLSPDGGYGNVADVEFYGTGGGSTTTSSNVPSGNQVYGSPIGTSGSWNNSGNTLIKAFDGQLDTYFDAPSTQGWVGYDFGSQKYIASARFSPRAGQAGRMVGGVFQVSNDGYNWSTVATIASQPAVGQYTTINFNSPGSYRYVRYLSPDGGYGNVAELQIFSGTASASEPIVITAPEDAATPVADATPIFCLNPIQSDLFASEANAGL